MATRCFHFIKGISRRNSLCPVMLRQNSVSYSYDIASKQIQIIHEKKGTEYRTENNLTYLEDPDTFGTLSRKTITKNIAEDEGDIQEEEFLQNHPLKTQKLTIKQYADIIKQYLEHKRFKEAIDVLEVRMLKEDRVKPENYIYNILIGACAEFGYTKKAFKLYNDMKKRGLKPTGDTYTCLFEACINSPYKEHALKQATHLRNLMIEKGIEPNLTNYNVMIKSFGRCGDLLMAFKIVDEMISKKIKIRVHTFNHLLHACISDRNSGLRHALIVWRKMFQLRERPNIYSFNLILKCVRECNLGSKEDIKELIDTIQGSVLLNEHKLNKRLQLTSAKNVIEQNDSSSDAKKSLTPEESHASDMMVPEHNVNLTFIDKPNLPATVRPTVPNLLAKTLNLNHVCGLQEVHTVQDKFAIVGGQDDFLQQMEANLIKPDLKTFTQMLAVIENSTEAENKFIETMKTFNLKPDIGFYNMLIKKRCFRLDYDSAFDVKKIIESENKSLKGHPLKRKKKMIKFDIMTYGTLAMACKTKEQAVELLEEMKEKQLKVNITILGTLLRHGTAHMKFGYIVYIMKMVKQENLQVNDIFIKHLELFNDKCKHIIRRYNEEQKDSNFILAYNKFNEFYNNWLHEVKIEKVVNVEDPWQQFKESYPTPVQKENFQIVEPKRFYKRKGKSYPMYKPRIC